MSSCLQSVIPPFYNKRKLGQFSGIGDWAILVSVIAPIVSMIGVNLYLDHLTQSRRCCTLTLGTVQLVNVQVKIRDLFFNLFPSSIHKAGRPRVQVIQVKTAIDHGV